MEISTTRAVGNITNDMFSAMLLPLNSCNTCLLPLQLYQFRRRMVTDYGYLDKKLPLFDLTNLKVSVNRKTYLEYEFNGHDDHHALSSVQGERLP